SARTTRLFAHVPGISSDTGKRANRHWTDAELWHGGQADEHRAGLAAARDNGCVLGDGLWEREQRAASERIAAHHEIVFDREWHPIERATGFTFLPPGLAFGGAASSAILVDESERIDRCVVLLDASQTCVNRFHRRCTALPVKTG